jgi:PTS system nitrogen regulatory IIA component
MTISSLIRPDAVLPALRISSKKALLQELCDKAAALSGASARAMFDAVLQRERLGSTGVGNGVAIPHGKLPSLEGIFGVFARLEKPIDFEAIDGAPVDLVFLLIAPESAGADHLKALAKVARLLRDPQTAARVRGTRDKAALYAVLVQGSPTSHAA